MRVAEDELTGFLAGLDAGWRGLSLTMPLKRRALGLARSVTPRAALAGAANTLLLEDGVVVLADNTDLPGARRRGPGAVRRPGDRGDRARRRRDRRLDRARAVRPRRALGAGAGPDARAGGRRRGRDRRAPVGTRR